MNATEKLKGTVKFYNSEKGFGFLKTDSGDLFFHATKVLGELPKENDTVEYSIGDGKRGPAAVDVEVI